MKKWFTMILILCIYSSTYAEPFTVRFGKGSDCMGFNICGISTDPAKEYNEAVVEVTVTKSKHIQFSIPRKNLTDKAYFKFFSTGVFVVDGDYILPKEVCNLLKMDSYIIHSGKYEIAEDNSQYVIIF